MCGISGLYLLDPNSSFNLEKLVHSMGSSISHRGPDSSGIWVDQALGIGFSHQRLSVLDLSSAGHQPMRSASGRFVITFNGEIYNHLSLRSELEKSGLAPVWIGHSDTETLLACIEAWGLDTTLQKSTGMWAFALIDLESHHLILVRDRFGEKPLYWGFAGDGSHRALLFASDLSAIRAYPAFNAAISHSALTQFFQFGYIPAPFTIYGSIRKLPAGHCVTIPLPLSVSEPLPTSRPWWSYTDLIQVNNSEHIVSQSHAIHLLEETLSQSISEQTISDVPLGAFLSGGIDSSLITALLQAHSSLPVRTFTIGFEESGFNEAPYARAVASYLGTDHHETILTSSDVLHLIPTLPLLYTEPFADSSQLATHLVCREARRAGLTVALSGDGGDELFGGYNRYVWAPRLSDRFSSLPRPARRTLARFISRFSPSTLDSVSRFLSVSQFGNKAHKFAERLANLDTCDNLYLSLLSCWPDPSSVMQGETSRHPNLLPTHHLLPDCLSDNPAGRMMAWDILGYLPDDILVKVDRASMSVGLETRAPFLDHRLAALSCQLPMEMKIRGNTTKWALRQVLYKHLPRDIVDRPKAGFANPIGHWLRGSLRTWADELLNPDRLLKECFLLPDPITILWQQHLSGKYDHSTKLWPVLMWQSWLEQWG